MSEPTFAEYCLVQLDRLKRTVEELETQLRGADEILTAAHLDLEEKFEVEKTIILENQMLQSVGVNINKHEGKVMIQLVMRDQDCDMKIPAKEREEVTI